KKAGYEDDRWQIHVVECDRSGAWKGKPRSITEKFDASPEDLVFSADGKTIYTTAEEKARTPIFAVDVESGEVKKVLEGNTNGNLSISEDGKTLAFTRVSLNFPAEVYAATLGGD